MFPKKSWRWGIGAVFFLIVALVVYHGTHKEDGFCLSRVQSDYQEDFPWKLPPLESSQKLEVERALSQNYRYLSKGSQCYAFVSEDGRYILKLLKHYHYRIPSWQFFLNWEGRQRMKRLKRQRSFDSYVYCATDLKEVTGTVCVQLNRQYTISKVISVTLKSGAALQVDLTDLDFILQRRAFLVENFLKTAKKEEVDLFFSDFDYLIHSFIDMGFMDRDRRFDGNIGYVDGHLIWSDLGEFYRCEGDLSAASQELYRRFFHWLSVEYPEIYRNKLENTFDS